MQAVFFISGSLFFILAASCALFLLSAEICVIGDACPGDGSRELLLVVECEVELLAAESDAEALLCLVELDEFAQLETLSEVESHRTDLLTR